MVQTECAEIVSLYSYKTFIIYTYTTYSASHAQEHKPFDCNVVARIQETPRLAYDIPQIW
jgi:hypothetical protein